MNTAAGTAETWLQSRNFDLSFIVGVAALALVSGAVVTVEADLFLPVLVADLWLLGYHHVVATFTRLTFDSASFKEHYKLVVFLPLLVAAAVTALTLSFGLWLIPTIYLHWQWYHYTRQSEGISKAFRGKARGRYVGDQQFNRFVFWLVPVAGFATLSSREPASFLSMPVEVLPVPVLLAQFLTMLSGVVLSVWAIRHYRAARRGELALPYFLYMVSHFVVFIVAYIAIDSINIGWLTINIWHNAQYILFVWLFNNRRFGGKPNPQHKFLSSISQSNRFVVYITVCLAISTGFYLLLEKLLPLSGVVTNIEPYAMALIVYQTINFHHYIVDSRIWKLRKKPIREKLGITG